MKKIVIGFILLALNTQIVLSDGECSISADGINICELAVVLAEVVNERARSPTDDFVFDHAYSLNRTVYVDYKILFTKEQIKRGVKKQGLTVNTFKLLMAKKISLDVCPSEGTSKFVGLGGQIKYTIFYSDGPQLTTFDVNSCA